jgi:hypothetical protein
MQSEDREGRSAPAGGSGGGTDEQWTEEDFKQRVRERLDRLEQHQERIEQRLDRIEGHGGGPPRGGRGGGRGEGRGGGRREDRGEGRGRRRRGG